MKHDIVYLSHMLYVCRQTLAFNRGKSRAQFNGDKLLQVGLAHMVQTIGEAARHVSREFQEQHSEIPWSEIIGMRHKVVHDYLLVDRNVVWKTVSEDLDALILFLERQVPPEIIEELERELDEEDSDDSPA